MTGFLENIPVTLEFSVNILDWASVAVIFSPVVQTKGKKIVYNNKMNR